ncbi:MAG: hypothetical protein IJ562_08905 [Prevotella sp.]|nr:hypothetical protein [Prevotella sp.]
MHYVLHKMMNTIKVFRHEKVVAENIIMAHQFDATPTGLPVGYFWVKEEALDQYAMLRLVEQLVGSVEEHKIERE